MRENLLTGSHKAPNKLPRDTGQSRTHHTDKCCTQSPHSSNLSANKRALPQWREKCTTQQDHFRPLGVSHNDTLQEVTELKKSNHCLNFNNANIKNTHDHCDSLALNLVMSSLKQPHTGGCWLHASLDYDTFFFFNCVALLSHCKSHTLFLEYLSNHNNSILGLLPKLKKKNNNYW